MKKYIVTVRGTLNFNNGKSVLSGGFIPKGTSDEEIAYKLSRGHIAEFDESMAAAIQSGAPWPERGGAPDPEIKKAFAGLTTKLEEVTKALADLKKENADLKKQLEEIQEADMLLQEENKLLKADIEKLKKAAKR